MIQPCVFSIVLGVLLAANGAVLAQSSDESLPGLPPPESTESKTEILKSDVWRNCMLGIQDCFDRQRLYSKNQIGYFKRQINEQVKAMPASQMIPYMNDWNEKVAILNGPDGRTARLWMREQASLMSDEYLDKAKKRLPDLTRMNSGQLNDFFQNFAVRVAGRRKAAEASALGREEIVKNTEAELKDQERERDQAMAQAIQSGNTAGGTSIPQVDSRVQGAGYQTGWGGWGGGGWGGWGGLGGYW